MKVVAFNGSARRKGNTRALLDMVLAELQAEGIETERIDLAGKKLSGCIACMKCWKNKDRRCAVTDDEMNDLIQAMDDADGILLGSPTYFANVPAELKALIDRGGMTAKANGNMHARKVGAGVVAVRRCGAYQVFSALNAFFLIGEMVVPGSSYWNMGRGLEPGDVNGDEEGRATMRDLGRNMAWLLKKIR
ncbi:flavodoxin family protein [Desulfohalovibrio reitneri]|uniref:flavodoxin family protein n=1 Tax=Desulfohalovibrio reitneri TaxID=1307759 RepID=UPI0004A6F2D8|nr:flavodoxin family protein [Desulfohalovibrio reitneri]